MKRAIRLSSVLLLASCWLAFVVGISLPSIAAASSPDVAPKWGRFEHAFKSSVSYANPIEDTTFTVQFTSPLGDSFKVPGFWNGGRTWLVRFSPNMPGKWKYKTSCSDISNIGLQDVAGEFVCSAVIGKSVFTHHGPVRVARDRMHLEFDDRHQFFWLADTVGAGARLSDRNEWDFYTQVRASQEFTAVQFIATPGQDNEGRRAYYPAEHLKLDLDFFDALDSKVDALNRAGLLAVIVPISELTMNSTNKTESLPENQAVALVRYMVARWGANDVAWLLACDGSVAARWRNIGREVFGEISHAPVILFTGDAYWALDTFQHESWVNVFGYQTGPDVSDDALQWQLAGPVPHDWQKAPSRPFINIMPPTENDAIANSRARVNPHDVRRTAIWSLLVTPTVGVSYSAHSVKDWNMNFDTNTITPGYESWRNWEKALYLPGAKQMCKLAQSFNTIDFRRLIPAQDLLLEQPGTDAPAKYITVASSLNNDLIVAYTPQYATIKLRFKSVPDSASATWFNPTTGATSPASTNESAEFTPPGQGDWILVIATSANGVK